MLSCDAYYISKLIPDITYEDVICSMGLSNGLFELKYDQNEIYMMKSRFVTSQVQLLDRLGIEYKKCQIEDLFSHKLNQDKVLIFLPKMLLDNIDSLHTDTKQLALSMSSYVVKEINMDTVTLTGIEPDETEYEKTVTREQLEKINQFEMKPAMESLIIVELAEFKKDEEKIKENIRESMTHCLDDYDSIDNGELIWSGGKFGYRKLYEMLVKYDDLDETVRKVLVGTMVSGSNFFYRKEYWEALTQYKGLEPGILNELRVAGGLWRKVIRALMNHLCFQQTMNLEEMKNVLERIENTELRTFSYIKNNI